MPEDPAYAEIRALRERPYAEIRALRERLARLEAMAAGAPPPKETTMPEGPAYAEIRAVLDAISDALAVLYVQFAASEPLPIADELPA